MAIGKNPGLKKGGKGGKGGKKKVQDSMSRKEWYDFKAPAPFSSKSFGKTCISRTQGTRISTERIKGRVVETSLADLKSQAENMSWRKVKLIVEDIEGRYCRTSFYGLDVTRDKLCQMIRKWQSLIESTCEVKTQDGYVLRVFVIGFTRRTAGQVAKTSYAQRSQIKKIRQKMVDILTKEAASNTLTNFVKTLITDSLGENIINACKFIYPLTNVLVRKVKMLKRQKLDAAKLNDLFKEGREEVVKGPEAGKAAENEEESKNLLKK